MTRLASHVWVSAYLARLGAEGIYAHLVHKGHAEAGAVAVKLAFMDGTASLFTRYYDLDGHLSWTADADRAPEPEVDARIARMRRADRDLWVVEVEDARGRHLLGESGL